ncbi:hypothetical protein [Cellulophaga sp. HaHaR_3_176]|uniref:hypothetical protein n=1 Tax=Cellulophaga sp. HaHaR_3_176 TaxID=1942464 RepID=UPI0020B10AD4|nr:hypothetical protein [Cellulophaga sp. HaHaR_3_176]
MTSISIYKIDMHRRLCIEKDLNEASTWISTLESFNNELDHLSVIEKQLIKNASLSHSILAIRRKNILNMASLCKYEQELKTEYEYGKVEYNAVRSKYHEKKRQNYLELVKEQIVFKNQIYSFLKKFKRQ